ncbi:golgin subfamily A member 6-like protein 6 [Osmia bicornis bicornis]|uniref:golgin subfamily A member 6-like protein 6 n=1 Tax=Osmia bicornis bicornis TaxID=1437191 RepID=UPI0010F4A447|nr:golgin subfamily A member 6-like protein 6 [Osmia bicornis bicornis]
MGERGRPSNIEALRRGRTLSIGSMENLEEIWKRKRDEGSEEGTQKGKDEEGRKRTRGWMFKESNLTERSPEKKKEKTEGAGGVGEIKELIKDLGRDLGGKMERVEENMRDLRKEVREEIQDAIEKRKEEIGGELEKKWERKEKEERRRNIIIRGTKVRREGMKEKAEEILQLTGVENAIEEVKEVGAGERGKEVSVMLLKIKSNELKRRIMENKKALKGREERIEEDLTWAERKTQWMLRKIGREEREKRRYVWVDHGKIRIEGKWWRWDEEKGRLVDGEGKEWKATQGGRQREGGEEQGL